nr:replication associated protein [Lake Sarah-associated circular virus-37]ALE29750.1 replication associated protein [Lake Sarah-associated circular virus-37]ALE29752.1 replication associated protein [Lake Sarah-associated circular virus-37]ALE29754.1 replication associated protein [Lake Sarah-associated circular virus-37]ALE29756.1 replication associated protein [Lake Sarah-associated circular virus-37]
MESFRQTKGTWWSVTAYGDNIIKLEDKDAIPDYIRTIYGGREQCPTTGRLHFQGALQCASQCRAGRILDWLPGVHLEKAKNSDALKKYVMKEETAAGEKTEVINKNEYTTLQKAMELLAEENIVQTDIQTDKLTAKQIASHQYWQRVRQVLEKRPELVSIYASPLAKTAWTNTCSVWMKKRAIVLQPASEEFISGEEKSL